MTGPLHRHFAAQAVVAETPIIVVDQSVIRRGGAGSELLR